MEFEICKFPNWYNPQHFEHQLGSPNWGGIWIDYPYLHLLTTIGNQEVF